MTKRDLCEVCGKPFIDPSAPTHGSPVGVDGALRAFEMALDVIVVQDRRYPKEAYGFVLDGCSTLWEKQFEAGDFTETHLAGERILEALREHAITMYGKNAKSVLHGWHIFKCEDFGEIVFNLISVGLLVARPEDSKEDFSGGYDINAAFP